MSFTSTPTMQDRTTELESNWTHGFRESVASSIDFGAPEGIHTTVPRTTQQVFLTDLPTIRGTVVANSALSPTEQEIPMSSAGPVPSMQHERSFQGSAMFPYTHDCIFTNPVMVNIQKPSASRALQWLQWNSIPGVEHDSAARTPPPLCRHGTRSGVITEIQCIRHHPQLRWKLIWVRGLVGVGKSAIVQTLAETEARQAQLGATLFFPMAPLVDRAMSLSNTPTTHNDDSRIWLTICYRLATKEPSYRDYVTKRIDEDPKLVEKGMEHQFKALIAEPIGRDGLIQSSLSIWLDGLDQCGGKNSTTQERIIQLIDDFIMNYPSSTLVWIIASRPERRLTLIFEKLHRQGHVKIISIPLGSDDALRDVRHYLRGSFDDIQNDYDTIQPLPWPNEKDFNAILLSISGLFLFASAIVHFVGDREIANPMKQFASALSLLCSGSASAIAEENPLAGVHRVYAQVLQSVPKTQYRIAKRILGFLLLPCGFGRWARDSTSFWALCNILDITPSDAYACLDKLHSLVEIPKFGDTVSPARLFHNSLANYLANEEYSTIFWIDVKDVVADLWQCHFRVLQNTQISGHSTPQLSAISLAWASTPEEMKNFRNKMWENARRVFFHHLLPCSSNLCPFGVHYDALSDLANPSELVRVLREIRFHNLVDGYVFPDVPYRFLTFLDRIMHEGKALLQTEGILQTFDMANPNYLWIDRLAISFKFQDTRLDDGGHTITVKAYTDSDLSESTGDIYPSQRLSTRETPGIFAELLDDLRSPERNLSTTIILGPAMSDRCVVLVDTSLQGHRSYYVLPYGVE